MGDAMNEPNTTNDAGLPVERWSLLAMHAGADTGAELRVSTGTPWVVQDASGNPLFTISESLDVRDYAMAAWCAVPALIRQLKAAREDVVAAAGELRMPIPAPGTDAARLLVANRVMARERDEARTSLAEWRAEATTLMGQLDNSRLAAAVLTQERDEARARAEKAERDLVWARGWHEARWRTLKAWADRSGNTEPVCNIMANGSTSPYQGATIGVDLAKDKDATVIAVIKRRDEHTGTPVYEDLVVDREQQRNGRVAEVRARAELLLNAITGASRPVAIDAVASALAAEASFSLAVVRSAELGATVKALRTHVVLGAGMVASALGLPEPTDAAQTMETFPVAAARAEALAKAAVALVDMFEEDGLPQPVVRVLTEAELLTEDGDATPFVKQLRAAARLP